MLLAPDFTECVAPTGDGCGLGRVQQAGEISGAAEDGAAGSHEPQRHPSGESGTAAQFTCRLTNYKNTYVLTYGVL